MDKKELFTLFEELILILGERSVLDGLFDALSSDALEENLTYIADMNDLSELYEQ